MEFHSSEMTEHNVVRGLFIVCRVLFSLLPLAVWGWFFASRFAGLRYNTSFIFFYVPWMSYRETLIVAFSSARVVLCFFSNNTQ